jgi:rhodanese-related sulfurtransferase
MTMRKNLAIFAIALFAGTAVSCQGIYENSAEMAADCAKLINEILVEELQLKVETGGDYYIIDIRQPDDFYTANIPGSVLLSRGILEFKVANIDFWFDQYMYPPEKDSEIIIYSNDGTTGVLAAMALQQLGYTKVYNLKGGYKAYNPDLDPNAVPVSAGGGCGG